MFGFLCEKSHRYVLLVCRYVLLQLPVALFTGSVLAAGSAHVLIKLLGDVYVDHLLFLLRPALLVLNVFHVLQQLFHPHQRRQL